MQRELRSPVPRMKPLTAPIREYWNHRIHDLEMTDEPVGSLAFFDALDDYRFDKLRYLPASVDFEGHRHQRILEIGCGIGTDLVRFARGGARVVGIDLAERSVALAARNAELHDVAADGLCVADGEALPFTAERFDLVYAHGVIQYTANPDQLVAEAHRVLKPGGQAIFMVYNRYSWLSALSRLTRVDLKHADAPVLRTSSIRDFRRLLGGFASARIVPERFPVRSRLHTGWKGSLYNSIFVRLFDALPRRAIKPLGWHLMAFCQK